jgi:hypothetical protein
MTCVEVSWEVVLKFAVRNHIECSLFVALLPGATIDINLAKFYHASQRFAESQQPP